MTLPTPDAQSPGSLSHYPHPHSTPTRGPVVPSRTPVRPSLPTTPPPPFPPASLPTEPQAPSARERASSFATHPWDLATGGLKTLTAKRELPQRSERRTGEFSPETDAIPRNYLFLLVVLACIVIMLISGGVVLFMMLQP